MPYSLGLRISCRRGEKHTTTARQIKKRAFRHRWLIALCVLLSDPLSKDCGRSHGWRSGYRMVHIYIPHRSAPCGRDSLSAWSYCGILAPSPSSRVALPLPFLDFIIAPIWWLVNTFLKLFLKILGWESQGRASFLLPTTRLGKTICFPLGQLYNNTLWLISQGFFKKNQKNFKPKCACIMGIQFTGAQINFQTISGWRPSCQNFSVRTDCKQWLYSVNYC